jgi:hypothetical protein
MMELVILGSVAVIRRFFNLFLHLLSVNSGIVVGVVGPRLSLRCIVQRKGSRILLSRMNS